MTTTHEVAQRAALLAQLREVERHAGALIDLNETLCNTGLADCRFYAVVLGREGLANWRRFLEKEFELTW